MSEGPLGAGGRQPGAVQGLVLISLAWVSVVAAVVLSPVLPAISRAFAGTPALDVKIALVATGPALLVAALSLPCGALADRIGRRSLLLASLLLYGVAGVAPLWLQGLDQIVVARLTLGLAEAAIMTCSTALIIDYFHGARRGRWLAVQTGAAPVVAVVCGLVGAALGGLGWRAPFTAYALGFVFFPLVLLLIWEPARAAMTPAQPDAAPVEPGFSWTRPVAIAAVVVFSMIFFMVPIVQFGFLASERGMTEAPAIGLWGAASTIGIPLGAAAFNLVRAPIGAKLTVAYALYAAGFALMGLIPTVPAAVAGGFLASAGGGFMMPTAITWLLGDMPAHLRGRGAGLWTTANFLGQFLSPLAVLALSRATGGLSGALVACSAACLVATLIAGASLARGALPHASPEVRP